jgi:DNA helicase-2/ATP-dependent DNA helicase PcrA
VPSDLATGTTAEIKERRLLYVAMTRAKDQLPVMVPQKFFTHGQRSMGDSPCLHATHAFHSEHDYEEFPKPLLAAIEGNPASTRSPVDVKAKMRGMWDRADTG